MTLRPHLRYLKTVLTHKWYVFLYGYRLGVPIWRLVIHDWTKFTRAEWPAYVERFAAGRAGKEDKDQDTTAFKEAWKHHWKTNPHHWEHWVPWNALTFVGAPHDTDYCGVMPELYIREMVADWKAASKVYSGEGNCIPWYEAHAHKQIMHPSTRRRVEELLGYGGMGQ